MSLMTDQYFLSLSKFDMASQTLSTDEATSRLPDIFITIRSLPRVVLSLLPKTPTQAAAVDGHYSARNVRG